MMYKYIYKIIFENGFYYIGKHTTKKLDDNYGGSGVKLKQYREENPNIKWKKEILCFCDSLNELNEKER